MTKSFFAFHFLQEFAFFETRKYFSAKPELKIPKIIEFLWTFYYLHKYFKKMNKLKENKLERSHCAAESPQSPSILGDILLFDIHMEDWIPCVQSRDITRAAETRSLLEFRHNLQVNDGEGVGGGLRGWIVKFVRRLFAWCTP